MGWEFLEPGRVRRWLTGDGSKLDYTGYQDAPFLLAGRFDAGILLDLAATPNAVPSRLDEILFLIGQRLEWLLDESESIQSRSDLERESEIESLAVFVAAHPHDFLERWPDLGLGSEYDTLVIPFIQSRLESRGPDA